ncbi:MAG: hypothetical protein E7236_00670 [Lachnospiraceae bacterium]|nr:hypothetical protein [Lachnospiraceae bacterium]
MKNKKRFTSRATTTVLAAAAVVVLALSGVTGARAALTYFSETYTTQAQMYDIGVSLMEKSGDAEDYERVAWRDYSRRGDGVWNQDYVELLGGIEQNIIPGKVYPEELAVQNSGTIDEYVRVTIRKYWVEQSGDEETGVTESKDQTLDPDLIDIHFINDSVWEIEEDTQGDEERTVLYYKNVLKSGDITPPLCDTLTVDGYLATKVTQTPETFTGEDGSTYTRITTTYDYDGMAFKVEARVDAIQTHNADDAAISAWGHNYANFTE